MSGVYSPFEKEFSAITIEDLGVLRSVPEGWYVEYKREAPPASNIAKSISALANHYGGWLFYGVSAPSGGLGVAESFPGVPRSSVPQIMMRIRDAVRMSINPPPHFEARALDGPAAPLGVEDNYSIVVVFVPPGSNTPYIHASGRIYRRVGDSSDPKPETDRSVLDLLYERSRRKHRRLNRLIRASAVLSEAETRVPYVRLLMVSDPLGDRGDRSKLTFEAFASLAHEEAGISFDNAFPFSRGFVARHLADNKPSLRLFTWEYYHNGTSAVEIPLRSGDVRDADTYNHAAEFCELLDEESLAQIVDLNLLFSLTAACIQKHIGFSEAGGIKGPFLIKARLRNIWRRIPFLDTPSFMRGIRKYGIPVVQEDSGTAPPGVAVESFVTLGEIGPSAASGLNPDALIESVPIFNEITAVLGVSPVSLQDSALEILEAAERGAIAHRGHSGAK
jgi:schlafen family protein